MLRIIGGSLKGRQIKAPEGAGTRPTSSKVREAVFDILSFRIAGSKFLDLYAGSGAMGIEALSRGASFSLFVESHHEAVALLKDNLARLGLDGNSQVLQMPAEKALRKIGEMAMGFDMVFMDPPYRDDHWDKTLTLLGEAGILERGASIILEHGTKTKPALPGWLREIKSYKYGDSSLILAGKAGEP